MISKSIVRNINVGTKSNKKRILDNKITKVKLINDTTDVCEILDPIKSASIKLIYPTKKDNSGLLYLYEMIKVKNKIKSIPIVDLKNLW